MSEGVEQLNDGKVGHRLYTQMCFYGNCIIQKHCRYWIQTMQGIIEDMFKSPNFSAIWKESTRQA